MMKWWNDEMMKYDIDIQSHNLLYILLENTLFLPFIKDSINLFIYWTSRRSIQCSLIWLVSIETSLSPNFPMHSASTSYAQPRTTTHNHGDSDPYIVNFREWWTRAIGYIAIHFDREWNDVGIFSAPRFRNRNLWNPISYVSSSLEFHNFIVHIDIYASVPRRPLVSI